MSTAASGTEATRLRVAPVETRLRVAPVETRLRAGAVAAIAVAAVLGGCATGPSASAVAARTPPGSSVAAQPRVQPETAPRAAVAPDWKSFPAITSALHEDIERRAAALKRGPIGNRAVQLASLRLASNARDLIHDGSPDGALEALQRAISLYGGNGYAYLWLAYVHDVQGRRDRAAEFVGNARRYLPDDAGVRAELEGLARSIRQRSAQAAN